MSQPVPLSDPDGRVMAWACGSCSTVYRGSQQHPSTPEFVETQAQGYHRQAGRCCTCSSCGEPVEWNGWCPTCLAWHAEKRADSEAATFSRWTALDAALAPARAWIAAVNDGDDDAGPGAPPLDSLAEYIREQGELDERPALALLDVIAKLTRR